MTRRPWLNLASAIGSTIGLVLAVGLLSEWSDVPLDYAMIIGTTAWAAWDSKKIGLEKYDTGLSQGPLMLFFFMLFLWIIVFPWYLTMRHQITHGLRRPR